MKTVAGLALTLALCYGYIANIISLTDAWDGPLSGKTVLRVIGIPAVPIGIIMGYVP